ncbi:MAG: hypothetical protein ABIR98_03285 [Usitatibacter sp.]
MKPKNLAPLLAALAARSSPHSQPAPMTPDAFTALLQGDIERWKQVAQTAGIQAE